MCRIPSVVVVAVAVPLAAVAGACSPRAVTPPSRTFVMGTPAPPPPGGDLQFDGARIITDHGPELLSGNARFRRAMDESISLEVDGGVLRVTNGEGPGDRNGYTGRVGIMIHGSDRRWAVGAGLGGGTSGLAGRWGSADVLARASGNHEYFRPVLATGLGYAAPFGDKTFVVDPDGSDARTLQLPRNVFLQLHAAVEIGPRERCFLIGASYSKFYLRESSIVDNDDPDARMQDTYVAFGIGVRLGIGSD